MRALEDLIGKERSAASGWAAVPGQLANGGALQPSKPSLPQLYSGVLLYIYSDIRLEKDWFARPFDGLENWTLPTGVQKYCLKRNKARLLGSAFFYALCKKCSDGRETQDFSEKCNFV
ncbi:MAG: hypothetical protein ACYS4W_12140 [Planctomycetota bacterium]|jgi:hypothetical protein